MIREILREGLRLTSKNWKYIFLLWGSNVVLALVLTIPIFSLLLDNLSHSVWSDSLVLNLDYVWLIQFQRENHNLLDKMPLLFFSIVGINVLSQKFYQGGLIGVFNNKKKNHISDFFYSGVKYWFRFIKVSAVSILLLIVIYFVDSIVGEWISYLYNDLYSVVIDLLFRSINYLILLFFIGVIAIVSEYTQIYLALNNSNEIWKAFRFTLKFIKEKFFIVFITFLIVSIIGAVGAVVYNIVSIYIPRSPFYFLILTFILQQMLIIFRLSITMLLYATEVYLFKDQNAEIISE